MSTKEKQFAKTFDEKQDQFVIVKSIKDLEMLERIRYLDSQINLLLSKIEKILRMMAQGVPVFGAEEGTRKLKEFERRNEILESKAELYGLIIEEVRNSLISISDSSERLASDTDTKDLISRLNTIEKSYGGMSSIKLRSVFLNIVETVELLRSRVKSLEHAIDTLKDVYLGSKVRTFKQQLQDKDAFKEEPTSAELSKTLKQLEDFQEKMKD